MPTPSILQKGYPQLNINNGVIVSFTKGWRQKIGNSRNPNRYADQTTEQRGSCFDKATTTDAWLMGHICLPSFPLYHRMHAFQSPALDGVFVQ
jgi:hypothetical protein